MPIDQPDVPPPPNPTRVATSPASAVLGPPPPKGAPIAPSSSLNLRADKPDLAAPEVLWVLGAGFVANLVGRELAFGSVLGVVPFVVVMVLIAQRRVNPGGTRLVLLAATALLPWLILRSDPALLLVNIITIFALLSVAAGLSIRGSLFDTNVRGLAVHLISQTTEWIFGLSLVVGLVKRINSQNTSGSVLRGVLIAVPVLVVFGALLASADEVFARFLLLDNMPTVFQHVILTAIFGTIFLGLLSRAAHETPPPRIEPSAGWIGRTEVVMVLGAIVVLFAAFTITQVVVALGGAQSILETEGLTQADHARSGFFQLMWVSALATVLVGLVRWSHGDPTMTTQDSGRDVFTPLALLTLGLTIAIAVVSMSRFAYYVGAFGLSLDRIWAMAIVITTVILIAVYMASIVGWRSGTGWYPGVAMLVVTGLVFSLNVMNPSAAVADYNMGRDRAALDTDYIAVLPDDAVPTIIENLSNVSAADADALRVLLCNRQDRATTYGALEYNRSAATADSALDALCPEPRPTTSQFFD